jgi:hypothetical protein
MALRARNGAQARHTLEWLLQQRIAAQEAALDTLAQQSAAARTALAEAATAIAAAVPAGGVAEPVPPAAASGLPHTVGGTEAMETS